MNKKPLVKDIPVQFRRVNYGPFNGRTQSFQQYSVAPAAMDSQIRRSA
jgi:hypothetical protein